jgi:hypothetical protein
MTSFTDIRTPMKIGWQYGPSVHNRPASAEGQSMSRVALCATRKALDIDCPEATLAMNGWPSNRTNAIQADSVNDVVALKPVNDVMALII